MRIALAAVTAAAGLAAVPAAASAGDGGTGGLARFHAQRLDWKACSRGADDQIGNDLDKAGARCADVTVPLDHARPGGRTIKVAISRIRASAPGRTGAMLLNGGGPGPSLDMPLLMKDIMGPAAAKFDLIGMDPRSLGRSAPVDCRWPHAWMRAAGESRASFDRTVAHARDLARRCAGDPVIPHVSTRNIARDMDVVRAVLGERRISYNGSSYGTYVAEVYATLFPGRLDRVVLDGTVDPARWSPRLLKGTEDENERALGHWASWAARRHDRYGLGRTRGQVLASVREVVRASARKPLRVGRYRVDDTITPVLFFNGLDDDRDEPRDRLAVAAANLKKAAGGAAVEPDPFLAEGLGYLMTGTDAPVNAAQMAIVCGDAPAPSDPEVYWRDVRRARKESPTFGSFTSNLNPCAFWPWKPREKPTMVTGRLPSLIIAATGDTRTDYAAGVAAHRLLGGSRLVTLRADVHSAYQRGYGNRCVARIANDYQLTGRLPGRNLTCAKD